MLHCAMFKYRGSLTKMMNPVLVSFRLLHFLPFLHSNCSVWVDRCLLSRIMFVSLWKWKRISTLYFILYYILYTWRTVSQQQGEKTHTFQGSGTREYTCCKVYRLLSCIPQTDVLYPKKYTLTTCDLTFTTLTTPTQNSNTSSSSSSSLPVKRLDNKVQKCTESCPTNKQNNTWERSWI